MVEVDFEASKTNVGSKGPKFLRSELLAVNEVSVSKESGWRPLDWGRVSELVADFKSGAYGQNTLAPPSLIDSAACLCDGKRRPDNGLQCVAALQILTGELEESEANSEAVPETCLCHSLLCSGSRHGGCFSTRVMPLSRRIHK